MWSFVSLYLYCLCKICDFKTHSTILSFFSCFHKCAEICPPCLAKCETVCPHGRCNKVFCGVPCDPCMVRIFISIIYLSLSHHYLNFICLNYRNNVLGVVHTMNALRNVVKYVIENHAIYLALWYLKNVGILVLVIVVNLAQNYAEFATKKNCSNHMQKFLELMILTQTIGKNLM